MSASADLHTLARTMGIEVEWQTVSGDTAVCSDETLLGTIAMLGVPITNPEQAAGFCADVQDQRRRRLLDPVVVAWGEAPATFTIGVPVADASAMFRVSVLQEDGTASMWERHECVIEPQPADDDRVALHVHLPRPFPAGRHLLSVEGDGFDARATLLAAPERLPNGGARRWGVFAPLYALHDRDRTTTGDLGTLTRFARWAAGYGAQVVGTLPILATFLGYGDEPCDPSPYAPVSRRFWNEAYLDLQAVPEIDGPRPRDPAPGPSVDLPALAAVRRPLLDDAAARVERDPARAAARDHWLAANPRVRDYAVFRARREGTGATGERTHQYVQWMMVQQLGSLRAALEQAGQTLYLDLPIGSHRDGYDVAAEGELFIADASVGAPPDAFYAGGQNWGFPPIHPEIARGRGHDYLASCLAAQLQYAGALRIDHVMGLHRLWLIPPGADPQDGAYVRMPAEELWAVVAIEAARANATIVGENLGTVPPEADRALARHGARGMWVAQFEPPPSQPTADELACIDTHDLPTFAAWWGGLDPVARQALLDVLRTEDTPDAVHAALLAWLGASDADIVLAVLEDCWLETDPQNRPGDDGRHNFVRRLAYGIERFDDVDGVKESLTRLDHARREGSRT